MLTGEEGVLASFKNSVTTGDLGYQILVRVAKTGLLSHCEYLWTILCQGSVTYMLLGVLGSISHTMDDAILKFSNN